MAPLFIQFVLNKNFASIGKVAKYKIQSLDKENINTRFYEVKIRDCSIVHHLLLAHWLTHHWLLLTHHHWLLLLAHHHWLLLLAHHWLLLLAHHWLVVAHLLDLNKLWFFL